MSVNRVRPTGSDETQREVPFIVCGGGCNRRAPSRHKDDVSHTTGALTIDSDRHAVVNKKEQPVPYIPVFLGIDVSPVTKVATVTQSANAFSLGSLDSVVVASNVASITQ